MSVTGEPVLDEGGDFLGYRGTSRDVSQRRQAEARIRYLATHDELTGLPNRAMFGELLGHVVRGARRSKARAAVLFIDLDRFKTINDSLGHEAGDELLREIARRLKQGLRSSDVVARLGGDEFVVLLTNLTDSEQAGTVARKLLSAVIRPVELGGRDWRVTASIGIATFPDDATDEAVADEARRPGDVPGQGGRQEQLPVLRQPLKERSSNSWRSRRTCDTPSNATS